MPLTSSTKAPKVVVLTTLAAVVAVADLGLLGHRLDPGDAGFDQLAGRRVDADRAVVLDVDVGLELLAEGADRFAAFADHGADLLLVDLDRLDPRRVLGELLARAVDRLGHLAEDELAALVGLLQRVGEDLEGDAGDLDVHLQGGDPVRGAGDLEVHVAEVVLDAGDVGEDDVVVALLDQPHGHAGDRCADRHARGLQGHRGGADRAHRGGAVGLQRLGDDPDHVGEVLFVGDRRDQGPLGERAVADVAALGAAHEAGLPDREGREVVVVPELLRGLQAERVDAHVHARRAERGVGEDLRLAAGEERRAVHARGDVDLALDRPDLVLGAAVGALLVDGDRLADRVLLDRAEGGLDLGLPRLVGVAVVGLGRVLGDHLVLDLVDRLVALELALGGDRVDQSLAVGGADLARSGPRRSLGASTSIFSLPAFCCSSSIAAVSFLISQWAMSSASRISCSVTPLAPASTIRIASSVPATIRSRSSSA